jgi:hypothetical protein
MVLFAIFCIAARMLSEYLRGEPFDLVSSIVINLGSSWFLFYGLWWLVRRLPATVNLYSNGILKMGQNRVRPFGEMSGYNWSQKGSYCVLHIITSRGGVLSYGVPDPITRDRIEAALSQIGLKKMSVPIKTDFAARRKAIWGERVFTTAEVEAMREEDNKD